MSDEPTERKTVLFTVSTEVGQAAIAQVASCEHCDPATPSSPLCILDREDASRVGGLQQIELVRKFLCSPDWARMLKEGSQRTTYECTST
jgi:hypothetical protein